MASFGSPNSLESMRQEREQLDDEDVAEHDRLTELEKALDEANGAG